MSQQQEQTAQDLAKEGQQPETKRGVKLPIMLVLLVQMICAVAIVAIPLGYISLSNAENITNDLTTRVIMSTIEQTGTKLLTMFNDFSGAVDYISRNPEIPYYQDCCIDDMGAPNPNLTLYMIRMMQKNPISTAVTINFHRNATPAAASFPAQNAAGFGILQNPCSFFGIPMNSTCYVRIHVDKQTGGGTYGRLVNPETGTDLTQDILLVKPQDETIAEIYERWDTFGADNGWNILYTEGKFSRFSFVYGHPYTMRKSDPWKYSVIVGGFLPCLVNLQKFFYELLPTPASVIFFVDDNGMMVASTANNSVSQGALRYLATGSPDSTVSQVSQFIENTIAPFNQSKLFPNETNQISNIGGMRYIVATQSIQLPTSTQVYQLVLAVPRSDFYGASDNAFKNAIVTASCVAIGGILAVAIMAYFASLPLRALAQSMSKLTKFDFSVLENGQLDHQSLISELCEVETTFLTMVKAFAAAIRKNKELLTRSTGGASSHNQVHSTTKK